MSDSQQGSESPPPAAEVAGGAPAAKKPRPSVVRQPGTSILPTARVQRIIKADRDVDICSREATFLISAATELFVKRFTDDAYTNSRLDKRKVINYKDISKAVQQNEYLEFLKEVVPTSMTLSAAIAERDAKMKETAEMEAAILDGTLPDSEEEEEEDEEEEDEEEEEEEEEEEDEEEGEGEGEGEDGEGGEPAPAAPGKPKKVKSRSKAKRPKPPAESGAGDPESMDVDNDEETAAADKGPSDEPNGHASP